MTDPFERTLSRSLRAYADARVRPIDPTAVAQHAIGVGRGPRRGLLIDPRLRATLFLAAALSGLLLAGLLWGAGSPRRPLADVSPTATVPSSPADPGSAGLTAFHWHVDWDASGLDGHVIPAIQGTMDASVVFEDRSDFMLVQGYGAGCIQSGRVDVNGDAISFVFAPRADLCRPIDPTAVPVRLALARTYAVGLRDCSPSASPPGSAPTDRGFCQSLILQDADGQRLLVLRAGR